MKELLKNLKLFFAKTELAPMWNSTSEKAFCKVIEKYSFEEEIGLRKNFSRKDAKVGLFGYTTVTDYSNERTVIEVKVIQEGNEYEFKNALGQLTEQAFANNVNNAILLVYDRSKLKNQELGVNEKKFINIFKNFTVNNLKLNLRLIRLRLDNVGKKFIEF